MAAPKKAPSKAPVKAAVKTAEKPAAKVTAVPVAEAVAAPAPVSVLDETFDKITRQLLETQKAMTSLQNGARFATLRPDGTAPVFYQDEAYHIALPWGDVDQHQMHLLARHAPHDDVFLRQVIDLVPSLEGRILVEVGAYTGLTALILHRTLTPDHTIMFEPQKIMKAALETTIAVNGLEKDMTLRTEVIDEEGAEMVLGAAAAHRLTETRYLRRAGGPIIARSIDALKLKKVGFLSFDYPNDKLEAVRGAMETIERDRPFVCIDLSSRDHTEIQEMLAPHGYQHNGVGNHRMLFLPE